MGLPGKLERIDIVPLVARAWEKSFANRIGNVKAIAERGWGPALNRILLDDPDITRTMTSNDMLEEKHCLTVIQISYLMQQSKQSTLQKIMLPWHTAREKQTTRLYVDLPLSGKVQFKYKTYQMCN